MTIDEISQKARALIDQEIDGLIGTSSAVDNKGLYRVLDRVPPDWVCSVGNVTLYDIARIWLFETIRESL